MAPLKFAPWSSDIELSFYASLRSLKINHDKLSDAARKVVGRYEVRPNDAPERSARMQMHGDAFKSDEVPVGFYRAEGILRNVNTIEEYRALNTRAIIEQAGRTIWEAILDGTIYSCPSLLSSFHAIFFSDLKKYRFTYHFAFPAIQSDPAWEIVNDVEGALSQLGPLESAQLFDAVQTWRYSVDKRQHGFFLAKRDRTPLKNEKDDSEDETANFDVPAQTKTRSRSPEPEEVALRWVIAPLASFENGFFDSVTSEDRFLCFADPSTFKHIPSLVLRNLLALVRQRWHQDEVQILCYRDTHQRRDRAHSFILNLKSVSANETAAVTTSAPQMPRVTGWERNDRGVISSRTVDLSGNMDPHQFADQSVDLNIKLMKWRIAPDLDLDVIKNTKCLLLGAGTLGSYVSRNLLGWGVRKITFVDSGNVSYSNPVRQPLFNFRDCENGGLPKALRAAEALKEIYPGVDSKGYVMSVPMAGHPIMNEDPVKGDFELLEQLINEHDAIFLLMDTRESRWLPTVMGKSKGKIVMNAALGFDSYVVMRHGVRKVREKDLESLGCYFCNDVVAPADSLKDRTLDQQCTVTRPGIAAIASALLVELLVSILQHPLGIAAPAPETLESPRSPVNHPLGLIPHSIRGFLSNFQNMLIRGPNYDCCSACSDKIVGAYERHGWEFVKRALNEKDYVEELSGLTEVQRLAEAAAGDVEWDEEDDEVGEIEEG